MINLDLIKLHCRIDQDYDDELLGLYLDAAKDAVRQHTSRNWYGEAEQIPEDDEHGIHWNRAAELSMYLLIGHWYESRSAVTDLNMKELPMGFFALIQPYRIHGL